MVVHQMKYIALTGTLVAFLGYAAASDSAHAETDYKVCKSTYALCTTAKCTPIPGSKDNVACACKVLTGYSVGSTACAGVKESNEGKTVQSRYYPVKSYARCTNDRSWAWCLDKSCVVDKNDPTKAACTCSLVDDQGRYVIVTDTYTTSTCTTDIWSSATVTDIDGITAFLKGQKQLQPFDIVVINASKLGAAASVPGGQ